MSSEVELKFEVPPAMLRALNSRLLRMADKPGRRRKLVSVYFDTAGRALREEGLSLRVRHADGHHVQTVKGAGVHSREEWEEEIEDETPHRKVARKTALRPFTAKKTWRKLQPVFETDIARTVIPVSRGNSHIEVALDRGTVKANGHSQPIHEVELELKQGKLADLAQVAEQVLKGAKPSLGLRSKAERGYNLADDCCADPVCASGIGLEPDMTAEQGFRAIAFSCLHHIGANRDAVLKSDPEGVHQMRVGLRRLRAALSLFKPMLEGAELEKVTRDLKWLTGELGPARDFDVFVKNTIDPLKEDAPSGLQALESDLKQRREKGFARAKRMAQGTRYRHILLLTGLWLTGGDWATSEDAMRRGLRQRKLCATARDILKHRTAKVARKLKKLDELDVKGRHKLRIAIKKLRYAVGFFQSLFPGNQAHKRFAARLKELQGALGRLNDIQVHRDFSRGVVKGKGALPHGAYALGVVTGVERSAVEPCMAAAAQAGKGFRKLAPYWS